VIAWAEHPAIKALLPIPMLAAMAPLIYWFFAPTWRKLEVEATAWRQELAAAGRVDYRPLVTLTLGALILAMQEYYGTMAFYRDSVRPFILATVFGGRAEAEGNLTLYADLYGRVWWGLTRVGGYLLPFAVWRLAFRGDSLRDMGLRFTGIREHAWLYALFVVAMVPLLLLVARQPDFGSYYPIASTAGRSWVEFVVWEVVYIGQFLGLEMFFRGWWLRTTRVFGTGAIFSMVVPYCMIHFGKPYLEACAAIIAGVILGSLAMKTRSIWAGVAVHVTVAILMDLLALQRKNQLPSAITAGSSVHIKFMYWNAVVWIIWGAALAVLTVKAVRSAPALRAAWARRRDRAR
jgi:membrane protease YdiL (CAAX protease family)